MSDGEKLMEKMEVRRMEGRQELFTEGRQGGRGCTKGWGGQEIKDIKENVSDRGRGRF